MNYSDDGELRSRFAELREHDRVNALAFDAALLRSPGRMPLRSRWTRPEWLVAAAAVAVLVVGATLGIRQRLGREARQADVRIEYWQSPTATLLEVPHRELLAPPPLLSSVLDGVTTSVLQRKGD